MRLGLFHDRQKARPSAFEENRTGYVVGDIHGRLDLLKEALERIERDAARRARKEKPLLICLGDYIDRGPESAGVIEFLCSHPLERFETRFLKGNHEAAMLAFLAAPGANREWLRHGGSETLFSYGVQPIPSQAAPNAAFEAAAQRLAALAPGPHLQFLNRLERFAVAGDYLFVHAGVDCGRPLEAQEDRDLFWARKRFIEDRRAFKQVVVHGHSPVPAPYRDWRRICLDSGAYATGKLCVGRFEDDRVEVMNVQLDDGAGAYWSALS